MFTGISARRLIGLVLCRPVTFLPSQRTLFTSSLLKNQFDELKDPEVKPPSNRNTATYFDIDSLIANSPGLQDTTTRNDKFDSFAFGSSLRNPREVAKSINMFGPPAGRSVDVRTGLAPSLLSLKNVLKNDKIREMQNIQSRFIRPAKLQKMKKRIWWKQNFRQQFHYLMIDIRDAKRRGY
ncbi:hypothetical protein PUMCH_003035 [Australozyma saopauloensis]|uniref:Ribosomal protein S21 n=1 Tax=Australozyma saopauloensis TaxID=291208 RepID=A0AAX4HDD5_9ASCO|nr:hypothetical protein PUMCH_003035 [[Candida] saopauloensis]